MNSRFTAWAEAHRDQIANALDFAGWLLSILATLVIRTISGAGVILLYFFFTATPDTTVYQLAQVPHIPHFWQGAFCFAVLYSVMSFAINGPSRRSPNVGGVAKMAQCVSSLKSPQ